MILLVLSFRRNLKKNLKVLEVLLQDQQSRYNYNMNYYQGPLCAAMMKSFDEVVEYFPLLRIEIFKGELYIIRLLNRILTTIKKLGIKSKKKGRKTVNIIINFMKIRVAELEIMTV